MTDTGWIMDLILCVGLLCFVLFLVLILFIFIACIFRYIHVLIEYLNEWRAIKKHIGKPFIRKIKKWKKKN